MAKLLKYNVRINPKFTAYLKTVPRGTVRVALKAIAEWLIGNGVRGLKQYPVYRYVSRARAYGKVSDAPAGYFSWRQFRYVMASITDGGMMPGYPRRTGETQRGYVAKETRGGYGMSIENKTTGAYYTRHDTGQARLNAKAGWRKVSDVVSTNIDGAIRHAQAAVRAFLKKSR